MRAEVNKVIPSIATGDPCIMLNAETDRLFRHLSLDGYDGNSGDVEAPTGHFTKVSLTSAQVFAIQIDDTYDDEHEARRYLVPGHYLVIVNNSGIVWTFAFDTVEDRDKAYDELDAQYVEYLGPEITDLGD